MANLKDIIVKFQIVLDGVMKSLEYHYVDLEALHAFLTIPADILVRMENEVQIVLRYPDNPDTIEVTVFLLKSVVNLFILMLSESEKKFENSRSCIIYTLCQLGYVSGKFKTKRIKSNVTYLPNDEPLFI